MSAKPTPASCPEHWQLFELVTEGSTELNAHVKQHVEAGCPACSAKLSDIQTIERARVMKDEFDAFFDELPSDDAPVEEREKFLSQFKRKSRPADRLGRLSFDGRQIAAEIVKLAGEQGIEAAKARLAEIEGDPARGYALLYAAQLATRVGSSDPASCHVDLALASTAASRSLPFLKDKGPAQPVCREQVIGEASILESSALNYLGLVRRPVRQRAEPGWRSSRPARTASLSRSLISSRVQRRALRAIGTGLEAARKALTEFQLYGQENWAGRTEAALGTLLVNRDRNESALYFFDCALRNLHPALDEVAYWHRPSRTGRAPSCSLAASMPRRRLTRRRSDSLAASSIKVALFSSDTASPRSS